MPLIMTSTQSAIASPSRQQQYFQVLMLALSAFIFNTTEFVPVGLLTDIANDFAITPAQAGWMLSIYAWIVAGLSLPLMLLTSKVERKTLLLSIFTLFTVSHVLSVFAWSFTVLIISRAGIALAHAIFWSITASIVLRVAPADKKTFALSALATGTSLAMILGVPLGRFVGQWLGWRFTFAAIAVIALVILLVLYKLLPKLPSLFKGSVKTVPQIFKSRPLLGLYLFIFILFTAHYQSYSYIEPFLNQVANVSNNSTTFLLLMFGVAGIGGSVLFNFFGERHNTRLLLTSIVILCLSTGLYLISAGSFGALVLISMIWGTSLMTILLTMQSKVLAINPEAADFIMSMFSGIINLGIGAGAFIGAQVLEYQDVSLIGYVSAAIGLLGLVQISILLYRYPSLR